MASDKDFFRSEHALGLAYERLLDVMDDTIDTYLRPFLSSPRRLHDLERFLATFDCQQTVRVESRLRTLKAPTLIVWGTDDIYFDVKWSHIGLQKQFREHASELNSRAPARSLRRNVGEN